LESSNCRFSGISGFFGSGGVFRPGFWGLERGERGDGEESGPRGLRGGLLLGFMEILTC
jgi:hypothetical protein